MTDVTGRDGAIVCKALAYAIIAIEKLPVEWQENSDREDMLELLQHYTKNASYYLVGARSHLERRGVQMQDGELQVADRSDGPVIPFPG